MRKLFVICTHVRTLHLCYKKNALVFSQSEVQNECDEVVVKLYVVQFWSEIILLLISNRTSAARSFGFEITRKISDQIALHAVQLALPTRWIGHIINHVGLLSAMCTTIFSFCTCKKVVHLYINFAVLSHGSRGSPRCLGCQARYCPMCNLPGRKQDQEKRTHGMCP